MFFYCFGELILYIADSQSSMRIKSGKHPLIIHWDLLINVVPVRTQWGPAHMMLLFGASGNSWFMEVARTAYFLKLNKPNILFIISIRGLPLHQASSAESCGKPCVDVYTEGTVNLSYNLLQSASWALPDHHERSENCGLVLQAGVDIKISTENNPTFTFAATLLPNTSSCFQILIKIWSCRVRGVRGRTGWAQRTSIIPLSSLWLMETAS